ncbi:hypothetical protein OAW32_02380 [bacterium]|nr:hypothetical protein [bacterium]
MEYKHDKCDDSRELECAPGRVWRPGKAQGGVEAEDQQCQVGTIKVNNVR